MFADHPFIFMFVVWLFAVPTGIRWVYRQPLRRLEEPARTKVWLLASLVFFALLGLMVAISPVLYLLAFKISGYRATFLPTFVIFCGLIFLGTNLSAFFIERKLLVRR
jgi:hypothetical protein